MNSATVATEGLFLGSAPRQIFGLLRQPVGAPARGALLFVPAFTEEMNKARRSVALAAEAFARDGWITLLLDPFATGDSAGEFCEATWSQWIDDVVEAYAWLQQRAGATPGIWAMRLGCLVASHALPRVGPVPRLLFWQAVVSGKTHLNQFLRLRVASEALADGHSKVSTKSLIEELQRGNAIEVAGYRIAPGLALPLLGAELTIPSQRDLEVIWLETASTEPPELSPVGARCVEFWRRAGLSVDARCVSGAAFWQTQGIEEANGLIELSRLALGGQPIGR